MRTLVCLIISNHVEVNETPIHRTKYGSYRADARSWLPCKESRTHESGKLFYCV